VYSLSREGDFFCLNAASGDVLWKAHLLRDLGGKRPVYGYAQSPLVAGGLVFLEPGGTNGSMVALEAATGAVRWRAGTGEAGYSSPRLTTLAGQPALALFQGEAFTLLDPRNGATLAAHPITTRDFCNTITPAVAGATAFVSNTGKDGTLRLDLAGAGPRVVWRKPEFGLLFNSPVLWQGRLYGFNDTKRNENELLCLDAATGDARWSFSGVEKGVFSVAEGNMILVTRQGELVLLALGEAGPKILARAQLLGGKSWVDPVLAGGRLYLRNNDGAAVCLDVSARPKLAAATSP
jgi:outer membrane protein assembly factor BamB